VTDELAAQIALERMETFQQIPWPIPAAVLVEFTDEDLDELALAEEAEYWATLNRIVVRVTGGGLR
jgi:hypothetical protein